MTDFLGLSSRAYGAGPPLFLTNRSDEGVALGRWKKKFNYSSPGFFSHFG